MKFTDRYFKFPYKMYRRKDWDKIQQEEEKNKDNNVDIDLPEPAFVIGVKAVLPEEIIGYETSFSYGKTIDEVKDSGPDVTDVILKNGTQLYCLWSLEEFENNLNEFVEKHDKIQMEYIQQEAEEKALLIKEALKNNLEDIKKEYEENKIPLPIIE